MAAAAVQLPPPGLHDMIDTRTSSPVQKPIVQTNGTMATDESYKPDLSAEVAMLSTKLVNAINYQTNLDDTLQQTRHELERMRHDLARERSRREVLEGQIEGGTLVRKTAMDQALRGLREELAKEKAAREAAESAKKQTEGELESLTTALFEEANSMVAAARKDTEAAEKRNSQLRSQLQDTENLLASQMEQLQDLKTVMERLERASEQEGTRESMPVTPIDARMAAWEALQASPNPAGPADVLPDHPLHFSQLISPILRTDIAAYADFQELLSQARRASSHSRQGSSGVNNLTSSSQPNLFSSNLASSTPSLPGSFFGPSSASNSPSATTFNASAVPPLRESKFYRRALTEDIEPTLRLDLAPGLSFLSRRSVMSSLLSGSLAVEPFTTAPTRTYSLGAVYPCSLCGEARKNEPYVRKYRFRTSESDDAQRYPLCDWCLGRIRVAGDFVGFLRMVRDGYWRCESEDDDKGAWEEATRLRERMFWARLGGGVVPTSQLARRDVITESAQSVRGVKSPRTSIDSGAEREARDNAVTAASPVKVVRPDSEGSEQAAQTEAAFERLDEIRRRRSSISVAKAILGASAGVLATGRPDAAPEIHEHGSGDVNVELQGDEHTKRTTDGSDETSESHSTAIEEREVLKESEAAQSIPTVAEPTSDPSPNVIAPDQPSVAERRPSAVQERIRAMEARAKANIAN